MDFIIVAVVVGFICGALSMAIASEDNKGLAFTFGLLLGPFGILISAIAFRK